MDIKEIDSDRKCELIDKYFKITADDFGYCEQRNKGILESIQNGVVNSTSVLVNGSAGDVMIDQPHIKIGLHLNLTEGYPISEKTKIPSLLDTDGSFHDKCSIIRLVEDGKINYKQVVYEITAQINKFISIHGDTPAYIDGHQHVHILPVVREAMVKVMLEYDIIHTRIPIELTLQHCQFIEEKRKKFYKSITMFALDAKNYFIENKISYPRYFIGFTTMSRDFTIENIKLALEEIHTELKGNKIQTCDKRLIEIMSHPGYPSFPSVGGCGLGPDNFALSLDRVHEMKILCSNEIRSLLIYYVEKVEAIFNPI